MGFSEANVYSNLPDFDGHKIKCTVFGAIGQKAFIVVDNVVLFIRFRYKLSHNLAPS